MNRRGFLKFLPAAVIGGKQAAAEAAEKLALGNVGALGSVGFPPSVGMIHSPDSSDSTTWARRNLTRLLDPRWLEQRREQIGVAVLDPDLASMKSLSLSVRISMQKDRNFEREISRERSYLEKVIAGVFD